MFSNILIYGRNPDGANTAALTKTIIEECSDVKWLVSQLRITQKNTDSCVEQYYCSTIVMLIPSFPEHYYNVIIEMIFSSLNMEKMLPIVSMLMKKDLFLI